MLDDSAPMDAPPDDGGTDLELPGAEPAAPPPPNYDAEANWAALLTEEQAKKIVDDAIVMVDRDWASGKKFRQRRVRQVELFAGILPKKPPGQEKVAQIHLSIIAQSVLILHATIHGQLFPPTNYIYGARAVTPAAFDRVRRLGLHMNWQVTTRIPEYLPANDRGMMQWLIYGTMFDCWYYDPIEQRPCYEVIFTDDLIMPYTSRSVRYDLADVPRKTRKLHKYQHEIEQLRDANYWVNTEKLFEEKAGEDKEQALKVAEKQSQDKAPMTAAEDRIQGYEPADEDPDGPRLIMEMHYWLKLPGQPKQRPVILTFDYDTKTILRGTFREADDPRDKSRFDHEMAANQAHEQAMLAAHQQNIADHAMTVQAMMSPPPHPMTGEPMPPPAPHELPPPPEAPQPLPAPAPVRKVPVEWFTKYGCIPNPEGVYDFGVGYLLEGDNIAADTLMSQYVTAMTLSMFPTFLYSTQAKMKRGDLQLRMGEGIEVGLPPGQLAGAMYQFQMQAPPNAVEKLIESRESSARALVGASNILTGEPGEANETATSVKERTSAARMNLAEMGNRFNSARATSMKNLARINSQTLDPVEYFAVTAPGMQEQPPEATQIARDDYLEDFQVTFSCDPRLASQPQRVQDAIGVLQQLFAIPPGAIRPDIMQQLIMMAEVQYLKALDRDDMANLIMNAPPPPPPPGPPGGPGAPPAPGGANGKPGGAEGGPPGPPGNVHGPQPGPPGAVRQSAGNPAASGPPAGPPQNGG
jgi:hypothetical protein